MHLFVLIFIPNFRHDGSKCPISYPELLRAECGGEGERDRESERGKYSKIEGESKKSWQK
jgi:hypothetical protein